MKNDSKQHQHKIVVKDLSARKDVKGGGGKNPTGGHQPTGGGSKPSGTQPSTSKPTGGSQISSVFS